MYKYIVYYTINLIIKKKKTLLENLNFSCRYYKWLNEQIDLGHPVYKSVHDLLAYIAVFYIGTIWYVRLCIIKVC